MGGSMGPGNCCCSDICYCCPPDNPPPATLYAYIYLQSLGGEADPICDCLECVQQIALTFQEDEPGSGVQPGGCSGFWSIDQTSASLLDDAWTGPCWGAGTNSYYFLTIRCECTPADPGPPPGFSGCSQTPNTADRNWDVVLEECTDINCSSGFSTPLGKFPAPCNDIDFLISDVDGQLLWGDCSEEDKFYIRVSHDGALEIPEPSDCP